MGGFTLMEVMIAAVIFAVATVSIAPLFVQSSEAFSTLTSRSQLTARSQAIMDRLVSEIMLGRFATLDPPIPTQSSWVRFDRIEDVIAGTPIFGNPYHIETTDMESDTTDGVDNDGDGLVDESGIEVWEDFPPHGLTAGPEDNPRLICTNLDQNGLVFTRNGAVVELQLTCQTVLEKGQPPVTVAITSGVRMRN